MNAQLLVAMTALLSLLLPLAIIAVIQLGCLISQLADLKAYVGTVISRLPVLGVKPVVLPKGLEYTTIPTKGTP